MAERITIMGNEPYAEWIERDGTAQRLHKAYRNKWPDGTTECVAIGDEFYVRFGNGDGMRRVYNVGDFDDEDEWCAQCGTPIDPDSGEYYCCDVYDCDAVLCDYCGGGLGVRRLLLPATPRCRSVHGHHGTLLRLPVRVRRRGPIHFRRRD